MQDFDTTLRRRRSVRGFLPQPLERAVIAEVFTLAALAPSNCNVQPWQAHVVSGKALRALGATLTEAAQNGAAPAPDVPMISRYNGAYRRRQIDAAKVLYGAMGIARDDHAARAGAFLRNLDAFGAPHAVFLFLPEGFDLREAADLGGYALSLMLAMTSRGIASCAQGALSLYPELVREHLGLEPGARLIMGIAFGLEDPDHPANAARTDRAPLADTLRFHD